jgi:RNA polymerase sigma factor (sigma-70 family)
METKRTGSRAPVSEPQQADSSCPSVSLLLLRWQETGNHAVFEQLLRIIRPQIERVAAKTLQLQGVQDRNAVDDAVALVLDHLRRLPGPGGAERSVGRFAPKRRQEPADPGRGFVCRLAQDRAVDVVRTRRRQRSVPFSQLEAAEGPGFEVAIPGNAHAGSPLIDRVRSAAVRLDPRQRTLVEMLLEGKTQAVIAHVLGINEGNVSRLRARTLADLRTLLADD